MTGSKGQIYSDQREKYKDSRTGHNVWRMTNTPGCTTHAQYFTNPATTPDGEWLIYGSDRGGPSGQLNLFKMNLHDGVSTQLTASTKDLKPRWSVISPDGKDIYYIEDKNRVKAVNIETLEERDICRIEGCIRPHELSVSPDNRFLTNGVFFENRDEDSFLVNRGFLIRSAAVIIDIESGQVRNLVYGNTPLTHAQFCPSNPTLLAYCHGGPWWYVQRLWLINSDSTENRLIFKQTNFEGAGHEFWSEDGKTIYLTCGGGRQPQGLWAVNVDGSNERCVLAGPCVGHGAANAHEDIFVIDELFNDCKTGLWHSKKGSLDAELLCQTGADWAGKAQEYHPHPRFLPDGKTVSFTSAMSGSSEVYLVDL
jgi:Tol biopolymer transport system component